MRQTVPFLLIERMPLKPSVNPRRVLLPNPDLFSRSHELKDRFLGCFVPYSHSASCSRRQRLAFRLCPKSLPRCRPRLLPLHVHGRSAHTKATEHPRSTRGKHMVERLPAEEQVPRENPQLPDTATQSAWLRAYRPSTFGLKEKKSRGHVAYRPSNITTHHQPLLLTKKINKRVIDDRPLQGLGDNAASYDPHHAVSTDVDSSRPVDTSMTTASTSNESLQSPADPYLAFQQDIRTGAKRWKAAMLRMRQGEPREENKSGGNVAYRPLGVIANYRPLRNRERNDPDVSDQWVHELGNNAARYESDQFVPPADPYLAFQHDIAAGNDPWKAAKLRKRPELVLARDIQNALAIPSDHPYLKNKQRQSKMMGKSYDHRIEKLGERAYNWQMPLEILLETTAPMTRREQERLDAKYKGERVLFDNHVPTKDMSATDVEHPDVLTRESVTQYIFDLTRLPRPVRVDQNSHDLRHRPMMFPVKDRILQTIELSQVRPFLTYDAFHAAIEFMQYRGHWRESRKLQVKMADGDLPPTIDTYNIVFRHMARTKHLAAFHDLLGNMKNDGVRPDAWTWAHFLLCVESKLVQDLVIEHMQNLGLLYYEPVRAKIAAYTIRPSLEAHLREGGSPKSFVEVMNMKWRTKYWLKTRSINELIASLGWQGYPLESVEVLITMLRKIKKAPDVRTFHKLMDICRGYGKPEAAVAITQSFEKYWAMTPDTWGMHQLLSVFAVSGMANCCRVIWQFACTQGRVDGKMKTRIRDYIFNVPHQFTNPTQNRFIRFTCYDSKIIAGRFFRFDWNLFWGDWLNQWKPETRAALMHSAASAVIDSDMQMNRNWDFPGRFSAILEDAYARDMQWKDQPEVLRGDIEWMMKEAMDVPLRPSPQVLGAARVAPLKESPLVVKHVG